MAKYSELTFFHLYFYKSMLQIKKPITALLNKTVKYVPTKNPVSLYWCQSIFGKEAIAIYPSLYCNSDLYFLLLLTS